MRAALLPKIYNFPLNEQSEITLQSVFDQIDPGAEVHTNVVIPVMQVCRNYCLFVDIMIQGRNLRVPKTRGTACWFHFNDLCDSPTGK